MKHYHRPWKWSPIATDGALLQSACCWLVAFPQVVPTYGYWAETLPASVISILGLPLDLWSFATSFVLPSLQFGSGIIARVCNSHLSLCDKRLCAIFFQRWEFLRPFGSKWTRFFSAVGITNSHFFSQPNCKFGRTLGIFTKLNSCVPSVASERDLF